MTYPWVLHLATHTPDGGGEASLGLWNLWHFRLSLAHGTSPFTTRLLAPPYSLNLVFHTYTVTHDILALPLLAWVGLVPALNLLTLFSFVMAGLGAWLLAMDLTGDPGAAFIAGLVYTFAPYRFAHLIGHYNLASTEWLPFCAFFALRFLRGGRLINLALASLSALATTFSDYNYGVYMAVWSVLLGVAWLMTAARRPGDRRRSLVRLAWLASAGVLVHLPLLLLMRSALAQGDWVGRPPGLADLERFSADLAAFLTPSEEHPLWGNSALFSGRFPSNFAEGTVFLGWLPLGLALVATVAGLPSAAARRTSPERATWLLTFWGFGFLALGPTLQWRGQKLLPLPARWLAEVPIWRELRVPSRFTVMVVLALGVMCALALAWLFGSGAPAWRRALRRYCLPLAALIVLLEYLPAPLRLSDRAVPPVYRAIAADTAAAPHTGAVLDLPVGLNDSFRGFGGWNPLALYHQTITGRPVVGAHISRIPLTIFDAYRTMPIVGRLGLLDTGAPTFTAEDVAADRQVLNQVVVELDLRYIVAPEWYRDQPGFDYVQQVFAGCLEPLPGDDTAVGYRILRPCP